MAQVITGKSPGLIKAMKEAGVLPDNCKRMIIDVAYDDIVIVYYECHGDKSILDVDFAFHIKAMVKEKQS